MTKIAQISDLHLLEDPAGIRWDLNPQALFDEVLALALAQKPDALLLTGDLVHDESTAGYQRLAEQAKACGLPVLAIPGNHDDPAKIREFFGDALLELSDVTVIGLDTHIQGSDCGFLGFEQLARLEQLLTSSEQNCLIVLHHPPLKVGSEWIDELGMADVENLQEILEKHRDKVSAVLSGHVHQEFTGSWAGIPVLTCPSSNRQFLPRAKEFETDSLAAGFRLLNCGDEPFTSQVMRIS